MIDLGRAPLHAAGVTVFPDHADPTRFHFLPDAPRLRLKADGTPELSLLKYQLDPTLHAALGGGLLSLTVDLSVPDEVQALVASKLKQQFSIDKPVLSPVTVEDGACDLVVIDQPSDGGLVERVLGGGAPSLYGDEACTFMVVLASDGVGLVERALTASGGAGLPAGVVYRLGVLGLRPALSARITARWQDAYHYYENRLHGGKLLLAVDVGTTVDELVHSEAIHIEVDQLVPPEQQDPTYQRALDQVQRYVLDQFFKPTLGQAPPPADSSGGALATIGNAIKDFAGFFSLTYSLIDLNRDELKTMTYSLAVAQAEKLTLAPQGTFSLLAAPPGAPPLDASKLITTVPAAASDQMDFDVGAAIDLAAEQIDHLEVLMSYGARSVDLELDAASPRKPVSFFHEDALGLAVKYHYEIHFQPGVLGVAGVLRSPDVSTESRVIRVNPRELYQRIAVTALAAGVPFDRYPQVIVDVQVPDPAGGGVTTQTLTLDAAHREAGFVVRAPLGAAVPLSRRLRYVDPHGVELAVDWASFPAGILIVGDPQPVVLTVEVLGSARFGTAVSRLVVELRLASHPDQVTTKILTRDQPSATWTVALADRADRAWEYRVTVQTPVGEVRQGQWLAGDGGELTVGEGIARLRPVTLMFVGRTIQDLQLLGIKVRFAYDDNDANLHAEDELMVTDSSKPVAWSYPIADVTKQAYTYQLSLVHADGHIETRDPVTASDLLLIVPLT
ncbi:MAG TPA: hypothetical protein VFF06_03355 [Polyangia bacterium]|nr:hypothetical protein [Polyangia bacterium]